MVNKRRFRDNYKASLGRHHFSRADILVIEKLLRDYANAYDERILRRYPKTETKKIINALENLQISTYGSDIIGTNFLDSVGAK